jgi:uncharacterized protein (DUF305 family)
VAVKLLFTFLLTLALSFAGVFVWHQSVEQQIDELRPSPVDVGFAASMTQHHQQAIIMAQLMLDGRSTNLKRLANNILNSQLYEYGEMNGWLKLWGESLQPREDQMGWLLLGDEPPDAELFQYLMDCRTSPEGMVGLASLAQINELRTLEGDERDVLFLKLMLAHHQGGIPMARFATSQSKLPAVRSRAKAILVEQIEEIDRMQRTLHVMALLATANQ